MKKPFELDSLAAEAGILWTSLFRGSLQQIRWNPGNWEVFIAPPFSPKQASGNSKASNAFFED